MSRAALKQVVCQPPGGPARPRQASVLREDTETERGRSPGDDGVTVALPRRSFAGRELTP